MPDWMCCSACDGHGRVLLRDIAPLAFEALEWLRGRPEGGTAKQCRDALTPMANPASPNAFHNRLEDLREWGFVEREKRGRSWVYRALRERRERGE